MSLHALVAKYGAPKAITAVMHSDKATELGIEKQDLELLLECQNEMLHLSEKSLASVQSVLSAPKKSMSR